MTEIAIIGAGPAGLAAAKKLSGEDLGVHIFEQGDSALNRKCPSPEACLKKCKPCSKNCGVGGAGTFSDGKFIGPVIQGKNGRYFGKREVGTNLGELTGGRELDRVYVGKGLEFFIPYGLEVTDLTEETKIRAEEVARTAAIHGADYILTRQGHVGTDRLPRLVDSITLDLTDRGVTFHLNERVTVIDHTKVRTTQGEYNFDYVILAPGRKGAIWLEEQLKSNRINYGFRPVDIGLRIEFDSRVLDPLVCIARDVKFSKRVPNHGDMFRTFCVCPRGVVTRETYEDRGINLVNGHSESEALSPNTNMAVLASIELDAIANGNTYADRIARLFQVFGGDKPVLQRLGDIKGFRRSKSQKTHEWNVQPTLSDCHIGDVGRCLPYTTMRGLLQFLDELSVPGLIPGLNSADTLLYGPEIKSNGLRIVTDEYLQTNVPGVYVAGDGSGISHGITGAAASGIRAAEGIIREIRARK